MGIETFYRISNTKQNFMIGKIFSQIGHQFILIFCAYKCACICRGPKIDKICLFRVIILFMWLGYVGGRPIYFYKFVFLSITEYYLFINLIFERKKNHEWEKYAYHLYFFTIDFPDVNAFNKLNIGIKCNYKLCCYTINFSRN